MIKLKKLSNPKPVEISTKNTLYVREMAKLRAYFKLNPTERARTRPPFDKDVLDAQSVLQELKRIQHSKCAYCETILEHNPSRFVSHYRPLSNAFDPHQDAEHLECYAWFAYEWRNLMLICKDCDNHKLNFFPIAGRTAIALSSWRAAQLREMPLLLNPFEDNPSDHLMFDTDGVACSTSAAGKETINILNLNRPALCIKRKEQIGAGLKIILGNSNEHALREALREYTDHEVLHGGAVRNCLGHVCRILQTQIRHGRYSAHTDLIKKIIRLRNEFSVHDWEEAISRCKSNDLAFVIQNNELGELQPRRYAYINRIEIGRFKGVEHFTLDLDAGPTGQSRSETSCTMLLGENATGKSSILQAIALALMPSGERQRLRLDQKSIIPYGIDDTFMPPLQPAVTLRFSNGEAVAISMNLQTGRLKSVGSPHNVVFGYGSRRYFVLGKSTKAQTCPNRTLFNQAANLPDPTNWLLNLKEEKKFDAVARALASLLSLRAGEFVGRDDHSIFIQRHTSPLPIEHLSDGYKSLFAMAVDIMREMLKHWDSLEFAQGIVLIDEIENHLHPRWKMRVMRALRDSFPRVQFITSTHDPLCLRGMLEGEVQVLYRDRVGHLQRVEQLPNVANLRIEQILTSDYFGLATTEDPLRQHALEQLAKYAAHGDSDLTQTERRHRDDLLENYGSLPMIGDTLDRQIIAQALTRHIRDADIATPFEHASAREASVRAIIEVLERNRKKYGTR
ncbi:AAA family ATPase [Pseudomonas syringae]|uniref:AAA family ATPase n=1 Tax=Pseudomonas syringae TaxID=317 RepID=UPI0007109505|nr:AAA family ATPase [Pseudomonas syringae]MDP5163605.1 AAA family ATPase [Pseudomonas syringae pv. aptata str. DSM 50252]